MNRRKDRVEELTTILVDQYFDLRHLKKYSDLGISTLREYINQGLPCFKLRGKVLVKRSEFDRWMENFRINRGEDLKVMVRDVVERLNLSKSDT